MTQQIDLEKYGVVIIESLARRVKSLTGVADRDRLIDACANLKAQNDKLSEELSCVTAELNAMRQERDEWRKAAEDAGQQIAELRGELMKGRERETALQ